MQQLIKVFSIPLYFTSCYYIGYYSDTIVTEWRKLYN